MQNISMDVAGALSVEAQIRRVLLEKMNNAPQKKTQKNTKKSQEKQQDKQQEKQQEKPEIVNDG